MTAAIALVAFLVLCGAVAPRALSPRWTYRAPALGIMAWQSVTVGAVVALGLLGLVLVLPFIHLSTDWASLVDACAAELRSRYRTPAGIGLGVAAAAGSVLVLARLAWVVLRDARAARVRRRSLHDKLELVGRIQASPETHPLQFIEIEQDEALVFCVPGRAKRRAVVVTSGARRALSPDQLRGVLAHERAHLRSSHGLVLDMARALERAVPLPLFRRAAAEIALLVEMHADDAARGRTRTELARALLRLAAGPASATAASAALGALGGGTGILERARRLVEPAAPLGRPRRLLVQASALGLVVLPVLIAVIPTLLALAFDCCGRGPIG